MINVDEGWYPPKRENPAGNRVNSGDPQIGLDNADYNTFCFSAGNSGSIQRRIIKHLLAVVEDGLDQMPPLDRLDVAGTDAMRTVCAPHKNPMEYISKLRAINGKDCILSVPVEQARIGRGWQSPIYYCLPVTTRQAWREALQKPQHVTGAGKVQS